MQLVILHVFGSEMHILVFYVINQLQQQQQQPFNPY
jgi:hypothetical protein